MALTLGCVTFDTTDAQELAHWWAEQIGGRITAENDGWYVTVALDSGPGLAFQKVEDPTLGKNRLHVDLIADDLDAEVTRLRGAGAGLVAEREVPGFRWVTLSDPGGNEFCVSGHHDD